MFLSPVLPDWFALLKLNLSFVYHPSDWFALLKLNLSFIVHPSFH